MAQDMSTIVRATVLTNSAAEFLETRAQESLGAELVAPGGPQYVPVRDRFVPGREIFRVDYHAESAEKLKHLEATLRRFAATIREQDFGKKLNIVLKDPKSYSMMDVLDIVGKVEESHRNADKVKSAMGLIRKCFRVAGEHHGQLNRLLQFVPNDSYGSVISGGFTMILGAIERADTLRTDIYDALADIPLRLQEIQDLAEVHYQSAELQRRADSVFVAIFTVLERIVNELTKSMARKGMSLIFKGNKHSFEITEAIADLEKRLEEFRVQAEICSQQRFGRMDHRVTRSMLAAENCEMLVAATGTDVGDLHRRFEKFERRLEEDVEAQRHRQERLESIGQALLDAQTKQEIETIRHEMLQTNVYNNFYVFLTGNPAFNSRTGSVDRREAMRLQKELAFPLDPKDPSSGWVRRNKKVVKNWLDHLQPVHCDVKEDLRECPQSFGTFSVPEKDKVQWIITSDEIHGWLRTPQSTIVVVESQTHPDGLTHPVSFTVAFLAKLLKQQPYPTACVFCGLRANASMKEATSGPEAMLASLFAQLLIQVRKKRPGVDIAQLGAPSEDTMNLRNIQSHMIRIRRLLQELPDHDGVFIVLDSVVDLTGPETRNVEALRFIFDLAEDPRLAIKILVTGILSASALDGIDHSTLYLPDVTDAGSQGINPVFFEGDAMESIEFFEAKQQEQQEDEESSSEESDDEFVEYD